MKYIWVYFAMINLSPLPETEVIFLIFSMRTYWGYWRRAHKRVASIYFFFTLMLYCTQPPAIHQYNTAVTPNYWPIQKLLHQIARPCLWLCGWAYISTFGDSNLPCHVSLKLDCKSIFSVCSFFFSYLRDRSGNF